MTNMEMVQELLENSTDGIITAEQVTAAGLHRSILQKFVDSGELYHLVVVSMCERMHGKMIFTCCSADMGGGSIPMIPHYICWATLTGHQRNTP